MNDFFCLNESFSDYWNVNWKCLFYKMQRFYSNLNLLHWNKAYWNSFENFPNVAKKAINLTYQFCINVCFFYLSIHLYMASKNSYLLAKTLIPSCIHFLAVTLFCDVICEWPLSMNILKVEVLHNRKSVPFKKLEVENLFLWTRWIFFVFIAVSWPTKANVKSIVSLSPPPTNFLRFPLEEQILV